MKKLSLKKKNIIEKIKIWETEKAKRDKVYFEEQERKEKQKQLEHDKQIKNEVIQEIWKEFENQLINKTKDMSVMQVANMINSVLDKIKGE